MRKSSPEFMVSMSRHLILVGCLVSLVSSGCSEPGDTPDEAMREFLRSNYLGEDEKAWAMIAEQDRAQITAAHDGLAKLGVKEPPKGHELLLIRRISSPYALKKLEVVGQAPEAPKKGDKATVKLEFRDGRVEHARLDHDGEQWRIRLAVAGEAGKAPAGDEPKQGVAP